MLILQILRTLLRLYALCLLLHFALPYLTASQQPWMTVLARLCEPGVRLGNLVAAKLLPDRRVKVDVGPLTGAVICWLAQLILRWFL